MASRDLLEQAIRELPKFESVTPADIAELPELLQESLLKTLRTRMVSLSEMAGDLGLNQEQASGVAALLIDRGFLAVAGENSDGEVLYRINLAQRKGRGVPTDIWGAITGPSDKEKS